MSIWTVIFLAIVSISLVLYFLIVVLGFKPDKVFGPSLSIAIIVMLLAGLGYYLVWEKSINVVIKSAESVLYKSSIEVNDTMWQQDELFVFSSETSGIFALDYRQQVKELLAADEEKICRDYPSQTIGSGRYQQGGEAISVCVNKKGVGWKFQSEKRP